MTEALLVLAASGGGAVVQAAGTDAWQALCGGVAKLLARGRADQERAELERLDRTRTALEAAPDGDAAERTRIAQAAVWQTRFETLLEDADEPERRRIAAELTALIAQAGAAPTYTGDHVDFRNATFNGPVLGSGTQHNHFQR
ncbi:hypothetical protein [Streptomyces sp. NEAU-NA10]|uniref:hypothetical protein n=1 Tax=Streptomyces sp. NEAU-NA10 TaxID=3416050 RepID=UPI003CC54640